MDNIFKHRLLLLATFLDTLPPNRFNYDRWVGSNWQGKADLSCGTTACALGWATTIPEIAEAGLILSRHSYGEGGYITTSGACRLFLGDDTIKAAIEACHKVFDLSSSEGEYLFIPLEAQFSYDKGLNVCSVQYNKSSPKNNATPKEVADHIRFFVSQKYPD